jgi:hypothetical protein
MASWTVSPFNGELLSTFEEQPDQQMEKMLAAADKTCREIWSENSVRELAKIVGKAASLMFDRKEKFARLTRLIATILSMFIPESSSSRSKVSLCPWISLPSCGRTQMTVSSAAPGFLLIAGSPGEGPLRRIPPRLRSGLANRSPRIS